MDVTEFLNKLKINEQQYKSNNILFFLSKFKLNNFRIKKIINKNITLDDYLNKIGGGDGKGNGKINNLEEYVFNDYKFIVRMIHGDSTDIKGKTHTIKFVSLDDIHENSIACVILNFDYKEKTAYIQSLGDFGNCVFCPTKNVNFKNGQILMGIIIRICEEKDNIDKIELTDISKFNCFNTFNKEYEYNINQKYHLHDNFDLSILSTLLKGVPYYYKYGFEPKYNEDIKTLKHNKQLFKNNIKLNKINIKGILKIYLDELKLIFDKEMYEKYKNIITIFLVPIIEKYKNHSISEFIKKIININPDNQNDKIILCNVILSFYKKIFNSIGYIEFKKKVYIKNL